MLTRVSITNYRSFVHAEADLSPFTLVIGANGSGKTNFLRFLRDVNTFSGHSGGFRPQDGGHPDNGGMLMPHFNALGDPTRFSIGRGALETLEYPGNRMSAPFPGEIVSIFKIDPDKVAAVESVGNPANIQANGSGIINTLDALKTGIRTDLFELIENALISFIPEIQKIGLLSFGNSVKGIEIKQKGLKTPLRGEHLSEGTRTLLALLTIIHQVTPPPLLLIEDLNHSLHPRLFEDFVGYMNQICAERKIQIIATTHNPYLLDCFQDNPDAVLLIEKENGNSVIRSLGPDLRELRKHGATSLGLSKLYLSGMLDHA